MTNLRIPHREIAQKIAAPLFFCLLFSINLPAHGIDTPKLILQITVDQLRGDLPTRYYDRLGEGGFKYLLEEGLVYNNAHHAHANTETIVGHTTLATGAYPSAHGMVGNLWFDRENEVTVYNIEDQNYHLLTQGAGIDQQSEIDPTQKAANTDGRSPNAILVSTFSDELKSYTGGQAKVFGVSVKDRGAVSMAGHAGKAFWFSKASGEFVTSNYYYDQYPDWVSEWNKKRLPSSYAETNWELTHDINDYLFGDSDDREWETSLPGYGRVFPHAYGEESGDYFTTFLTLSPAGDEITLDFAKTLIDQEQLGQDDVPDYLSISFSSTDYVGHIFGPSSLESEDNILRLDRTLAELFEYIDKTIGLDNTLIVLSADHGGADTPGYLNSMGIPAGYVDPDTWETQPAISRLKENFNLSGELITSYDHPYLYLSNEVIENSDIDQQALEQAIVEELQKFPSVSLAVSSRSLRQENLPQTAIYNAVRRNFHPKRSGDIYVVFEPNWFINDFESLVVAASHGSPWNYDSYVPIIFAGMGIEAKRVSRKVFTVDIAPTLSATLNAKPPSGAEGDVLPEVFD